MKKGIIFLVAILLFSLSNCKKYPEGGWSNVAIKHLFGGTKSGCSKMWKLKLYEVNGVDSTDLIRPGNGATTFENESMTLIINNARAKDYYFQTKILKGVLEFNENKNITHIGFPFLKYNCLNNLCERNIYNPEFNNYGFFWKIVRLKNDELILTGSAINSYKLVLALDKIVASANATCTEADWEILSLLPHKSTN